MTGTSSRFRNLPATPLAWSGVGLAIVYFCGALLLAQGTVAANLPGWSLWAYGLGFGALALALLIAAYARRERSWLILVGVVLTAFWWLQWAILGFIGLFIR